MNTKMDIKNLNLWYGEKHALKNTNLTIQEHKITAFIGKSIVGNHTKRNDNKESRPDNVGRTCYMCHKRRFFLHYKHSFQKIWVKKIYSSSSS